MSTEKPKRRLVGWPQYVGYSVTQGATYSFSTLCACGGSVLLLGGVLAVFAGISRFIRSDIVYGVAGLVLGAGMSGMGLIGLWTAGFFFQEAGKNGPVALLTRSSAGKLPEVETLVRASDLPPSKQQTELLRAVQYGKETPAEELLRATTPGERA